MVIVKYSGADKPRYAQITSRADLADCVTWLLAVLDDMEIHEKDEDTVIDLKDYSGEVRT